MQIDYEHTQLTDEEVALEIAKRQREAANEAAGRRARLLRREGFRFVGGML